MPYLKTEAGQLAFKQRSVQMSARQRAAFILFDGQRTLAEVLASTSGLGVTQTDIHDLLDKQLLQATGPAQSAVPAAAPAAAPAAETADTRTPAERYRAAYTTATRLTAGLGLRGFKLNLSVEAAQGFDELLALLPAIRKAAGLEAGRELARALGVPES
ncbi:hypothetical protein [Hydrogenophaga pseudoflava]|uniref:hypothetical protein n=1 Tax=Hydrogenophaga pseudoflava TaxID=47421 RepID=UPI0027E4DA52|nr:hypothetical protein [Hydrogenophaga pseudoflava]MDQ7744061.1 hypothetical protein [Hydrogenophaga pseudoflava]